MQDDPKPIRTVDPVDAPTFELDASTLDDVRRLIATESDLQVDPPAATQTRGTRHAKRGPDRENVLGHLPRKSADSTTMQPDPGHLDTPSDRPTGTVRNRKARKLALPPRQTTLRLVGMILTPIAVGVVILSFPGTLLLLGLLLAGGLAWFYTVAGYDAFWRVLMRPLRWYLARNPHRAFVVHRRLDRFAYHWDAVLDLFPEGYVAALYLPDVSDIAALAEQNKTGIDLRVNAMSKA